MKRPSDKQIAQLIRAAVAQISGNAFHTQPEFTIRLGECAAALEAHAAVSAPLTPEEIKAFDLGAEGGAMSFPDEFKVFQGEHCVVTFHAESMDNSMLRPEVTRYVRDLMVDFLEAR